MLICLNCTPGKHRHSADPFKCIPKPKKSLSPQSQLPRQPVCAIFPCMMVSCGNSRPVKSSQAFYIWVKYQEADGRPPPKRSVWSSLDTWEMVMLIPVGIQTI